MDYRITDYGAVADGTTNNRAAIQAAVDACTVAGGGRVIVPTGQFLSGTIVLKSNVTLYLEKGAELISSLRNVVKICYFSMWNILEKNSGAVRASLGKEYGADCRRVVFRSAGVFGGVAIRKRRGNTKRRWLYMYPVFWFDEPKSVEVWKRKKTPEARCGRIAVLYP